MLESFLAGALASLSADAITHPIDTIRTRLQVQTRRVGILQETTKLIHQEGWKSLYKGYPSVLCCGVPGNALFYFTYEYCKSHISPFCSPVATHLLSAAIANLVSTSIYVPMDVVKQQTMVQSGHKTLAVFRQVVSKKGLTGLYKGTPAAIITWTPYISLYFVFYEKMKELAANTLATPIDHLQIQWYLGCGILSGVCAAFITNPLDVVKTRIQTDGCGIAQGLKYNSIREAVVSIFKNEGLSGFSRGVQARMMWLAPSSALIITFYENYKQLLQTILSKPQS